MENNEPKKILIVEDEKSLSGAISFKLQKTGFETKEASDAKEALEIIAEEPFDLILLDILMPKMNGFDFMIKLRENGFKTPIIVTSNLSEPSNIEEAKKLGAVDFIVKSNASLDEIVEKVKKALVE